MAKQKTQMERRIKKLLTTDRMFAERFCLVTQVRREPELRTWLAARIGKYCADPATLKEQEVQELVDGARLYKMLFGKPFDPQSFLHRSLSLATVELLSFRFGSRESFGKTILQGDQWKMANRDVQYAAWVFGFIDTETLHSIPVKLYTRKFPPNKKWRR